MIIDEITNEMEYENSNSPYTNPALTEKKSKMAFPKDGNTVIFVRKAKNPYIIDPK